MKYNYIYKITNLINDKYYYGCHSTNNLLDKYAGSGKLLHLAYNKYGKENFKIEWLENFSTREEMLKAEKELITHSEVKNKMCYNLKIGGIGGSGFPDSCKDGSIWKGRKHSSIAKKKMSIAKKGEQPWLGKNHTKETILKQSIYFTKKRRGFFLRTPFGDFLSTRKASKHLGISRVTIQNWFYNLDKIIMQNTYPIKLLGNVRGKTFKEIGFNKIDFSEINDNHWDYEGKNISSAII